MKTSQAKMICLDEVLSLAAAHPLSISLKDARGSDLTIDASRVRHLGAQCGQLLVAGATFWRNDGRTMLIKDPSDGFTEGVHLLGLDTFFADQETSR